jgi:hypothetical protein
MLKLQLTQSGQPLSAIPATMRAAAARALTKVSFDVRDALREGMQSAFDRPKPFTLNAFRVQAASSNDLTATVWAMPLQAKYLRWEIEGGQRKSKAFEHKLHLFGGQVAIPTRGSARDAFGNMPLAFIKRVQADLNTGGTSKRFFAGAPKGRPGEDGVWARTYGNRRLTKVMEFASSAEYQERFMMSELAQETVSAKWESQLMRALGRQGT